MTYIPQSKLAEWREVHKPLRCPITDLLDYEPVVDHNHDSGYIRGVLSREANSLLGKAENHYKTFLSTKDGVPELPTVLRRLADYLERGDTTDLHPKGLTQLSRRFSRMKLAEQKRILTEFGFDVDKSNNKERTKLFREAMKG